MSKEVSPDETIEVPDAPPVPGLAFRRYRGEEDLPRFKAVFDASKHEDGFLWTETLEDFQNEYRHTENCDFDRDVLVVEVEGQVIGYVKQNWQRELDGTVSYRFSDNLLPGWRGRGIRRAMLHHVERRARQVAAGHADATRRRMTTWTVRTEVSRLVVLEDEGFRPLRYFHEMLRDLREPIPDLLLPEGLEVRPVPPGDYRMVFDAASEALLDHWGSRMWTDEDFKRLIEDPTFDPDLWVVAYDGDEVAGTVLNWINEGENEEFDRLWGYTEYITVRRSYRGKGLAKALVARSMELVRGKGMEHANLGVDSENPSGALHLYTGLGYEMIKEYIVYSKSLDPPGTTEG